MRAIGSPSISSEAIDQRASLYPAQPGAGNGRAPGEAGPDRSLYDPQGCGGRCYKRSVTSPSNNYGRPSRALAISPSTSVTTGTMTNKENSIAARISRDLLGAYGGSE